MHKRLLCLLLVLTITLPVFATDTLQITHNESFYQETINPDECLFDITDALSLGTPQYTAEQALSDQRIAPSVVDASKALLNKDALKTALQEYKGSILLICHEPEFYRDVVDEVWDCTQWTTKIF